MGAPKIATLSQRIAERRTEPLTPLIERRGGDERRLPRWLAWTREHEQAGSKDLTGRAA